MLSDHEQRVLDELERQVAAEAHGPGPSGPPSRRTPHGPRSTPRSFVVVAGGICALLVIVGVATAALALAAATALGWSLWRYWPELRDDGATTPVPRPGGEPPHRTPGRRPGSDWLSRYLARMSEEK